MSYANCDVFEEAYATVGPFEYMIGTFFMHLLAPLEATALIDRRRLVTDHDYIMTSIWLGYGVLAAWDYWHNPRATYGCSRLPEYFDTVAPFVLTVIETILVPMLFNPHLLGV